MMDIPQLYQIYLQHPNVQTDTRKLLHGSLYFALKGANFDGNKFATQALAAGAAYAIVDDNTLARNEGCIWVEDVLTTLQQLAKYHRQQFTIPFIAVTGSNGKTTTKELVAAVLRQRFVTYATDGNLNNHIGIPLTLLKIKQDAEMAIIEMGANHQKEIAGYCEIAMPTHGIITNCGKAHIEGFGGIEGVRKGKGELYDYLRTSEGTVFRNIDLEYLADMAHDIKKQITYGSRDAEYTGRPLSNGVFLGVDLLKPLTCSLTSHLVGGYNFPNIMTAVAVGMHFGVQADEVKNAVAAYNPDNSRSQWLQAGSNRVILDSYNANPTSMQAAIQNFADTDLPHKMLWIGGMKEMGSEEENEHRALIAFIAMHPWDQVLLVGKEFRHLQGDYLWFEDSMQAADYLKKYVPQNASILIKGSRGSKMELLMDVLRQA